MPQVCSGFQFHWEAEGGWSLATHMGDLDYVPDFQLQPGPIPPVSGIWGRNPADNSLSLSLSLSLSASQGNNILKLCGNIYVG